MNEEKTSLEKFIDSLEANQKELLSSYTKDQTLENLSKKFDKLIGHEAK